MTRQVMMNDQEQVWRWTEVDPWGHPVYCAESVWVTKASRRIELRLHEAGIRETVRDPDLLFIDPTSTARLRPQEHRMALVAHYVGLGRTHGKWSGNFIDIIVKWLGESDGTVTGFVQTIYLPGRLQPRLQLAWRRTT